MSLHDRIMKLPVTFCSGSDGWTIASEAAGVAAEADELMREMAEVICLYATAETEMQARSASDDLVRMYKKLQEQNQ